MTLPTSSATSSALIRSIATPAGRPSASSLLLTMLVSTRFGQPAMIVAKARAKVISTRGIRPTSRSVGRTCARPVLLIAINPRPLGIQLLLAQYAVLIRHSAPGSTYYAGSKTCIGTMVMCVDARNAYPFCFTLRGRCTKTKCTSAPLRPPERCHGESIQGNPETDNPSMSDTINTTVSPVTRTVGTPFWWALVMLLALITVAAALVVTAIFPTLNG